MALCLAADMQAFRFHMPSKANPADRPSRVARPLELPRQHRRFTVLVVGCDARDDLLADLLRAAGDRGPRGH